MTHDSRVHDSSGLTSLLLPFPLLVADLHGADGEDDGDDEELSPKLQLNDHNIAVTN